jgi:hypothetical protein
MRHYEIHEGGYYTVTLPGEEGRVVAKVLRTLGREDQDRHTNYEVEVVSGHLMGHTFEVSARRLKEPANRDDSIQAVANPSGKNARRPLCVHVTFSVTVPLGDLPTVTDLLADYDPSLEGVEVAG